MRYLAPFIIALALIAPGRALALDTVFMEDLTWEEVRDAMKDGFTTVMIPTGGTEQGGRHLVLGKHNYVMKYTAEQIARRIGKTLVAPVLPYVPQADIDPPRGHMTLTGTIHTPPEVFGAVVEYAARSLKVHGFTDIILIGDSGGNQAPMQAVAERLNAEWGSTPVRVYHLDLYNSNPDFVAWLKQQGFTEEQIGSHAAIRDSSELMFTHPAGVRMDKRSTAPLADGTRAGGNGAPEKASVEIGKKGIELKIDQAVRQYGELRKTLRTTR